MAFNFPSDDYGLVYGVGFDAGPKTAAAQDGDLADTESNADGEFEIDDVSSWSPIFSFCSLDLT